MLLSELEERERRFKLALRAAIPILVLVALIFYATFFKEETIDINFENKVLIAAIVFISVYFVYFFLERSVEESLIDPVTHGFNEKAFLGRIKKKKPDALALLLIDNLSLINQNYSNEEIDLLLYNLIHKLNRHLREKGTKKPLIARRYGAEFLIALETVDQPATELIDTFIDKHSTIDNIELDYRYAVLTNPDLDLKKDISQLINILNSNESEDEASKELVKDAKEYTEIEESIISAMKNGALSLSFRPLLNIHTDSIDIYEIAVKLKHPARGDILPRYYLPIINKMGLGREYDMMLLKHIVRLLPLVDQHISLTFNLSPFSLRDKQFQDQFFKLLEENNIDASRLIIQLYERKTHHNLSGYLRTLKQLRAHGVRICIDNFGASNASMEYMKHFTFDMIQFDREYVTELSDKTTLAMLDSLIKMAKELGITTVAKWVDKEKQKEKLESLGIDYLQGFGIAKSIDEYHLIEQYNKGKK
ncbi:GGDEF domain-containing protein [Sulfurovum sp.]|jgi:EAL domain-containing protein (putative c-di-GMP-specific phosphodiesterase class I)/GGDEF domain-containing protein|uniref:EAL domain-containing protein n=1 Tax=Sulfurovum sp. TaxID=1969726 RepID=UPI002A35C7AE|nr:GGDEF domain-containing protein [Sulfurovum sp.]MDD2451820.1 GGDEF domain-containing protein [Sulfurovum sp.]MDY0402663.1 GGDEF domain-containing protein [Sulfurovum sp.]